MALRHINLSQRLSVFVLLILALTMIDCASLLPALARTEQRSPEQNIREFSIVLDQSTAEYTIEVGGSSQPENLEIIVENLGDSALVNPRLSVNGRYDWFDVKAMVAEATSGCQTEEEKALALWSWVLYKRYQLSPQDWTALHPVRGLNGYGYGNCGFTSAWLNSLWIAAGLKARVQELWGHTVSEVYYNGEWHMLDGNVKVFYLGRDNRTIADLATIERDRGLIERTIHAHDPWVRQPDTPSRNEEIARYYSPKDNYEEHSYDSEIAQTYTLAMTLKPGEKFMRWTQPTLGKYEARDKRNAAPEHYANAQLVWEPNLHRVDVRPYLAIPHYGNIAVSTKDGRVQVEDLQDSLYTRPSVFTLPFTSPYPIVGAHFSCTLVKENENAMATIQWGRYGWDKGDLHEYKQGAGAKQVELDLDANIVKAGATYNYALGFTLRGDAEAKPAAQAGLASFRAVTDLQVSPHSFPALALGKNTIRFRRDANGAGKVRITHRWREVIGRHAPSPIKTSLTDGIETNALRPTLKWNAATDADVTDKIADYQVMVSLDPECRWPLSPTLLQNVGAATTEWNVPAGFLNPGMTYYWKVRARDSRGDIGEWSRVFRFRTAAGAK